MKARNTIRLSGTNLVRAADHNQRVTLHAIRVGGSLTRIELAAITGLTPPAIANITKRLLADGLIEDIGRRRGGRGQPPTKLAVRADACFGVGINVDRDHITVVIVNFLGETLARISREAEFALPGEVVAFYRASIDALIAQAGIDPTRIVGVGVAVPDQLGSVDLPDRPPAYAEWERVDIAALFGDPIGLPVFVENDAAAAAMGELQLGLGQKAPSFFYILVSWGLGGGLVIDGSYFRGADGRSGEIGFLSAPCGGRQIQQLVSLAGLSVMLEQKGFGTADLAAPRSPGVEAVVEQWIDQAAAQLVEPLVAINCLINPVAVLIGGRLPASAVEQLAARLNAALAARAELPALAPVRRAMLAEDAPAVGAAILPFSHFLLPKANALWKASPPVETGSYALS